MYTVGGAGVEEGGDCLRGPPSYMKEDPYWGVIWRPIGGPGVDVCTAVVGSSCDKQQSFDRRNFSVRTGWREKPLARALARLLRALRRRAARRGSVERT